MLLKHLRLDLIRNLCYFLKKFIRVHILLFLPIFKILEIKNLVFSNKVIF